MKLFVVSDVHSFYTPLMTALEEAGFDRENKEHWLIVCGDLFDRGPESSQLLEYVTSLPRKILVRGNHDDLFEKMCHRGYAERHDIINGTMSTVCDLAPSALTLTDACTTAYARTEEYRNQLVNYFETKNYIFVHGWIPCESTSYKQDWRDANHEEWESARWTNGIMRAYEGVIEPDKTVVCGHWHCSFGHSLDAEGEISEFGANAKWEPWYRKGCIAIDRCTARTRKVNVLVLEDEFISTESSG